MIKNKNILALCTTAFFNDRGCHTRILKILKFMEKEGNRIDILTYSYGRDLNSFKIFRIKRLFKDFDPVGFHPLKILFDIQIFFKTLKMLQKKEYDYLLSFTHEAGIISLMIKLLYGKEYVLDYQGSLYSEMTISNPVFRFPPFSFIIRFVEEIVEKKSFGIIYNTNFNFKRSKKKSKFYINDDIFEENKKITHDVNKDKMFKIVWLGINTKVQNLKGFLEIAENILKKKKNVVFYIISFPISKNMKNKYNLYHDRIIFLEKIPFESLPEYLKDADMCISTKLDSTEGSGKLHLYKRFCKNILSLDSKISREVLNEGEIVKNVEEMEERILERIG
ncbi:MAG: hypothetical protein ABIN35_02360 [candidate division WOR-3 bacterium]